MPDYAIRPFEPSDLDSLIATWNRVFAGDAKRGGWTRSTWEWKFGRNPAGLRIWVACAGAEVVGMYAGMPHRVWLSGREAVFTEIVDSMVHPEHRAGLKRPGLFVQVAEPMLEAVGGPERDLVCYGWPALPAWRIGQRFLEYELLRTASVLAQDVRPGAVALPAGVEPLERFDHQALWLWERCCGVWGASTIRDDAFLNWRFFDHPTQRYDVLGVRDADGILRGYAVVFVGSWLMPDQAVIVDWLVPDAEPEVGARLVEGALAVARRRRAQALTTVLPEWTPWYDRLQRLGFLAFDSDLVLAVRTYSRKFDALWLREHWWTTLADSDQL